MTTKDKSLGVLEKELDGVFSEFIRLRDVKTDGKIHCFTCGASVPWRQSHNGHFFKRGNMMTRFSEINCHAVCENCNKFDPNHDKAYSIKMASVYGSSEVSRLDRESRSLRKFMRHEIQEMIDHYKLEVSKLKKQKAL